MRRWHYQPWSDNEPINETVGPFFTRRGAKRHAQRRHNHAVIYTPRDESKDVDF